MIPGRQVRGAWRLVGRGASTRRVTCTVILAAVIVAGLCGLAVAGWSDVPTDALAPYGITESDLARISQGYPDGTWGPSRSMPRTHFVRMAVRLFEIPLGASTAASFQDVPGNHPYHDEIEGAAAAGLVKGVGGGLFGPERIVTRQQGAAILARYLSARDGLDLAHLYSSDELDAILGAFGDAGAVSTSLRPEVAYMVDHGLMRGRDDERLEPQATLTRIQGAALLLRAGGAGTPTTSTSLPSSTSTTTVSSATTTTGQGTTTTTTETPPTTTTTTTSATTTTTTTLSPATSTTTTSSSTTTSSPTSTSTTSTPGPPHTVFGRVKAKNGSAVAGATVRVELTGTGGTLVASVISAGDGSFTVHLGGLSVGTAVDVTASAAGYTSITCYGVYDELQERVDFDNFGTSGGDRRLPVGIGQVPPLPFEGLLPD